MQIYNIREQAEFSKMQRTCIIYRWSGLGQRYMKHNFFSLYKRVLEAIAFTELALDRGGSPPYKDPLITRWRMSRVEDWQLLHQPDKLCETETIRQGRRGRIYL